MFFGNCAVGDRWLGLREKLASMADRGQTDPLWTGLVWLLAPAISSVLTGRSRRYFCVAHTHWPLTST